MGDLGNLHWKNLTLDFENFISNESYQQLFPKFSKTAATQLFPFFPWNHPWRAISCVMCNPTHNLITSEEEKWDLGR